MHVVLPRQAFQDALSAVAAVSGSRTTRPILRCVMLRTSDGRVELSATDGEVGLRVGVPALKIERPGATVVGAERLLSIVRELVDAEISLAADDQACVVKGEGSEFRVYVQNPADFPSLPAFEGDADLHMPGHELLTMIQRTVYAAARETSRYAINGVLWEKRGRRLWLVATDGRRLARAGGTVSRGGNTDFDAIVPARALAILERVFAPPREDGPWELAVRVMPTQLLVSGSDRLLTTTLVEGHFPKYQDVIPKESDKRARLNRLEFHAAVRRAALLTTEDSRAVRLSFTADKLVITARSPEEGEARVEMPVHYEGKPLEIGFNPAFLADALKVLSCEEVYLELQENFRPGVLHGEDRDEFLYVVMPVSLAA